MTEKSLAALMKKYEAEKEGLHNTQDKNRRNQEDKLKVLALNILEDVWNALLCEVRHIQSPTSFNTARKTHLVRTYYLKAPCPCPSRPSSSVS